MKKNLSQFFLILNHELSYIYIQGNVISQNIYLFKIFFFEYTQGCYNLKVLRIIQVGLNIKKKLIL